MHEIRLGLVLAGQELLSIAASAASVGLVPQAPPSRVEVENEPRPSVSDWLEHYGPACVNSMHAEWGDFRHQLFVFKERAVIINWSNFRLHLEEFLASLSALPFAVASTTTLYPNWLDGSLGVEYAAASFGELHAPHGWACAFKGDGHTRLVSRRWLEYGPWRLLHGPEDTTLVQFHDLNASPVTALQQARPGHERMGIGNTGGYLQEHYVYRHNLTGVYNPSRRVLKIVVHGREVSEREMLDACAARHYKALGDDQPLDNIAYVFLEERVARQHLHQLWLRELECWTIRHGDEVRLDLDYAPVPEKPMWIENIDNADV